ncbi:MAG TPA: GTP-binding protein, partial [Thermoplasmata archaeon]|nr:GTP-binding protein [Thermoplasmata archaeon]
MGAIKAKVILLGDGSVGKTALIRRFVTDQFSDQY